MSIRKGIIPGRSNSCGNIRMDVKERTSFLIDFAEMGNADYREELIRQNIERRLSLKKKKNLEKRPFSDQPAATDHSSWPHKGQNPMWFTYDQEFQLQMIYKKLMPEHYQSLNTTDDKDYPRWSECFDALMIPKMRPKLSQMEETKKALAQQTEAVKKLKSIKENIMRELQLAEKQKNALEGKLDASVHAVEELEDKFISAVDLSAILRKQRDDIQFELDTVMVERDNIVREVEELRKKNTLVTEEGKMQKDNLTKELGKAKKQILALRGQLADSARRVKELEGKNDSALELLINSKKERDEIQLERDNALREAEELRQSSEVVTTDLQMKFFSVFPLMEIKQATQDFDPSLIIGRGGYGNVFKGNLRNTKVAIKRLHPNSSQGCSEFQKEVDVLSRVRHPNLLTLIGTCPEVSALIYEYLPNGSLEDRLAWEKNKTPPLSWQTRARIAIEICSALIFLHSDKPHGIVHGDLKPANVLLDANFVSKLGDFGICRLVHFDGNTTGSTTPFCKTSPKGTLGYIDPEFFSTGKLTPKSDVFAFGMVLLQLLTRRPAMGLVNVVQSALKKGGISAVLDASAGEWPLVQANKLARLALWCCKMNRRNRPDLASEVWSVLGQLKVSCGDSSSSS